MQAQADLSALCTSRSVTALHLAAEQGHAAVIQELLDSGAPLHAQDYVCRTPLHAAADGGHAAAVELLLARSGGMRIDSVTRKGMTALHVAAAGGHRAAVEALVRAGAHVSKKVWQVPLRRDAADLARKAGHDALSSYLRSMA